MTKFLLSLSAIAVLSGVSQAAGVLIWTDYTSHGDNWTPAIAAAGFGQTTATGEADFISKVGTGGWDWVVLNLSSNSYSGATAAISNWVAGGGKAITSNWYMDSSLATAFGANFTGNTNFNSFTHSGSGIFAGVANPTFVTNPGWGIYSTGLSALAGSTAYGLTTDGDAAVVMGNGGKTFINGFLQDTAVTPSAYQTIFKNQLLSGGGVSAVPAPGAALAFGFGLLRRRKKAASN